MSEKQLPEYASFANDLKAAMLAVTPAEVHGLVLGMLAGGLRSDDKSWQPLLFDYTNDGMGWPISVLTQTEQVLLFSRQEVADVNFSLSLLLPDTEGKDGLFERADAVAELVNHFISGLGLIALDVRQMSTEVKEALTDLEEIAKLGLDEDDDLQEQAVLLEQVIEHVKACILIIHAEHGAKDTNLESKPIVH
jgi:uncharacterized protein